jgi:hypothetical protein
MHIYIGADDKVNGPAADVINGLYIKRPDPASLLGSPKQTYEAVVPDLTKVPHSDPYRKGIPKEGWVRFDVMDYGSEPPVNGQFWIFLEDSLGNTHWIKRDPQSYKSEGNLTEIHDQNVTLLGSGS